MKIRFAVLAILLLFAGAAQAQDFLSAIPADELIAAAGAVEGIELHVTTGADAPQACAATICLTWDASPSAATTPGLTYNVYQSRTAGGCGVPGSLTVPAGCTKLNTTPLAGLTFNYSTPTAGRLFHTVRAEADTVLSPPSNELTVLLPPLPAPNLRPVP